MARRKKQNYPLIEALEITTLAAEGKAMGRYNEQVVFVPMTVPGDVVDVQIRNKRRRFMEGVVVNYVKRSALRSEPFCEHFGVCGGCKWQNLPYEEQLRFKTEQVHDQLSRIGKIALPEVRPCLGSATRRKLSPLCAAMNSSTSCAVLSVELLFTTTASHNEGSAPCSAIELRARISDSARLYVAMMIDNFIPQN